VTQAVSMRLLILGLLMEKNQHPYEIGQTIKQRNWHHSFKLRDGSLYYAVDQLRHDGLIEAAEVIPVPGSNRPDKTVYRISERGRDAFLDLLYAQMEMIAYPQHPLFAAMPFIRHGDIRKLEHYIVKQLDTCRCRITHLNAVLTLKQDILPRGSKHMIEGLIKFSETEEAWLDGVLADARSGRLLEGSGKKETTR